MTALIATTLARIDWTDLGLVLLYEIGLVLRVAATIAMIGLTVVAGTVDGVVPSLSVANAAPASMAPMRLRTSIRPMAVSPIFLFIARTGGCAPSGDDPHRSVGARRSSEVRGSPAGPSGQRLERPLTG